MTEKKEEAKTMKEEAIELLSEIKQTDAYKNMSSGLKEIFSNTVDKVNVILKESGKEAVDIVTDTITESVKDTIKEKENDDGKKSGEGKSTSSTGPR